MGRQVQMFLLEYEEVPYAALSYLTGECNYGGRVTDEKDRRCLLSILSNFYTPAIVEEKNYKFSPSGLYYAPPVSTHEGFVEYIGTLPLSQSPEVFGMHDNVDISRELQETRQLFTSILMTQARSSGGGDKTTDDVLSEISADILSKLPADLDYERAAEKWPVQYHESMNTVLLQEIIRFNRLLRIVRATLQGLQKAIKGLVVMSSELEDVASSLLIGKVPASWAAQSYPSLKPLGAYVQDFLARLQFLNDWSDRGSPVVYWISGFFFTQSFLTGVLQNYARKHALPIDALGFEFEVMARDSYDVKPDDGVYVNGLFIEGARWDAEKQVLGDALPKVLIEPMPILWLKPGVVADFKPGPSYLCPVYKTSARRGTLSTTGHSTNYVLSMLLPVDKPASFFINRGCACLLENV